MGWIIIESMVALALFVFIVWWTMSGTRKNRRAGRTGASPPTSRGGDEGGSGRSG